MILEEIKHELLARQDIAYRDFQGKLIPTIAKETMIGVRTPELRKLAKQLAKREDIDVFLKQLPHSYFDENQLHAFILSDYKSFKRCIAATEEFLPFIDNWATCDQMSPKVFRKHRKELLPYIQKWIASGETYVVRFAVGMLMAHFLEEDFDISYLEMVSRIHSEEYYVNMMIAWYFATALAKQYDSILPYIEERRLAPWTHNKTIQKAMESRRITKEQKEYLRKQKV